MRRGDSARCLAIVFATLLVVSLGSAGEKKSDAAIRKALIAESRASYSGNCACPYDTDSRGRSCGKRSAYSRPDGDAPLCYDHDVTSTMIVEYRKRNSC